MPTSDELINQVGRNNQEKANLIWSVADTLRGPFKPSEYGRVILPMTVIKRFHDCLLPTHEAVLQKNAELDRRNIKVKDVLLQAVSGYPFYNTSKFTFKTLLADPNNVEDNFRDYLAGFSANVRDILGRMDFDAQLKRLCDSDSPRLYQVLCDFSTPAADMSPDKITAVDMGYIFEELVRRFSESYDEKAGEHFTSRDIVYLMTDLLIAADPSVRSGARLSKTVYDQAMGTGQMLSCTKERLQHLDADARVTCFGQEFNPFTYGIAESNALIAGDNVQNYKFGDTLSADKFPGYTFDYCISNPPFGNDWKAEAPDVGAEHKRGAEGRFGPGLPGKDDGQMLFVLNGLSKLKDDGVMVIVQDASPLYKGAPRTGEDRIRGYLLENDWLDAIIELPKDSFYNTGISTYLWVVCKSKPAGHAGKVLLMDASECFVKLRKAIGDKRNNITDACRDLIVRAFDAWCEGEWTDETAAGTKLRVRAKVFDVEEFGYRRVNVYTAARDEKGELKRNRRGQLEKARDEDGKIIKDTEDVPLGQDIEAYLDREVRPYNPDAFYLQTKTDIKLGYTIPFTRAFYEYAELESSDTIAERIQEHEAALQESLDALFGQGGN